VETLDDQAVLDTEPSPEATVIREVHYHHHTVERAEEETSREREPASVAVPAALQPVTAAAVSQIGPLGAGGRSSLRFAMRQR